MHSFERVSLKARGKNIEIRTFTAGMKNAVNLSSQVYRFPMVANFERRVLHPFLPCIIPGEMPRMVQHPWNRCSTDFCLA